MCLIRAIKKLTEIVYYHLQPSSAITAIDNFLFTIFMVAAKANKNVYDENI